jgi:DNA-binding NtrC family response regulator
LQKRLGFVATPPHGTPIAVVTAVQNARQWCDEIVADACPPKPFDLDAVVEAVARLCPPRARACRAGRCDRDGARGRSAAMQQDRQAPTGLRAFG